jgi:paraquat-inducible protein B
LANAVLRRRRFPLLWLVPIVAVSLSLYLGVKYLGNRGPLIKISFSSADGITAQQTEVKYKAVTLGVVEDVQLTENLKNAVVHVRMNAEGARVLTDHARFWVVRPRLSPGNISGLETLVSGAYISVDPGDPGGAPKYDFVGLPEPPGVRSDEPGKTYRLLASRLGSLGPGSPLFYRDVAVGEVLGYDLGDGVRPITIDAFVRAPYDKFVHDSTHFFNSSGVSLTVGAEGLHLELESLQALLSGAVTFETPRFLAEAPVSDAGHTFKLYDNQTEADAAGFARNIPFVTYFTSSVSGLGRGSEVEIFGIQVGAVTDVRLVMDPLVGKMRARVAFDLQPERVFSEAQVLSQPNPEHVTKALVQAGMRAVLNSSNIVTGQKDISLQYVPGAPPATLGHEGDSLVLPSQGGGLDNITSSLSDITAKLDKIPFDEIGRDLADTLKSVDRTVSGPDVQTALKRLSDTLADVQQLVRHADAGMTPVLKRLPQISADLQQAVAHANALLGQGGYGGNSDFQRNMERLLDQVNNTARSIRLLADFLDRHPEALLLGRTSHATER